MTITDLSMGKGGGKADESTCLVKKGERNEEAPYQRRKLKGKGDD